MAIRDESRCHLGLTPNPCAWDHVAALVPKGIEGSRSVRSCPACDEPRASLWIQPGTVHRVDWFCELECRPTDIRAALVDLGVHESCLGGYGRQDQVIALDAARYQAVLRIPRDINARLYRICIQAVSECDDPPADPLTLLDVSAEEFHGLAARTGIERGYRYRLYKLLTEPRAPRAIEVEAQELYRHFDVGSRLLYIGISGDRESREVSHRRHSKWWELVANSTSETLPGRTAVLAAERTAIETEQPLFNVQYNDTPEARERLRVYLEGIGRMDLMRD